MNSTTFGNSATALKTAAMTSTPSSTNSTTADRAKDVDFKRPPYMFKYIDECIAGCIAKEIASASDASAQGQRFVALIGKRLTRKDLVVGERRKWENGMLQDPILSLSHAITEKITKSLFLPLEAGRPKPSEIGKPEPGISEHGPGRFEAEQMPPPNPNLAADGR